MGKSYETSAPLSQKRALKTLKALWAVNLNALTGSHQGSQLPKKYLDLEQKLASEMSKE